MKRFECCDHIGKPLFCIISDHWWWLENYEKLKTWCHGHSCTIYHEGIVIFPDEMVKDLFILTWG